MRYLLIPENNSLSHIAKSLAVRNALTRKGHQVHIAVSNKRSSFLNKIGFDFDILPDIQETDNSPFPTIQWFKNPDRIAECIKAELKLIEKLKPDRLLGVFRFTARASSFIAGLPYDSLICGCMIPDSKAVLGYADDDPQAKIQDEYLNNFYRYAGVKMSFVLKKMGLLPINDIRIMLKGERTFLWDFPEFMPMPDLPDLIHIGPIQWRIYPFDKSNISNIIAGKNQIAVVSFGTGIAPPEAITRIIKILLKMGFLVIWAAGSENEMINTIPDAEGLYKFNYAPLHEILPHAAVIITHGGQMTVFESLINRVPVIVIPYQPEQLHNGLCLERIGCGKRLVIPEPFRGNPKVYMDALNSKSDKDIELDISSIIYDKQIQSNLLKISNLLKLYHGAETLARFVTE